MNSNEYTVTMSYKEFEKWQKIEQDYKKLRDDVINCLEIDENINEICLNADKAIQVAKRLVPLRYQEYNYGIR